jgi:dolichol-phosphate mannosyltransferase
MYFHNNWAVVIPMANEEKDFHMFVHVLMDVLDKLQSGAVYFVVDNVSKDKTLELCRTLSENDERFITVWAPQNRNVVDAYINGYRAAYERGHTFIIEMDAGLSHDPRAIPMFLRVLNEGNECAFGSRFIIGGSTADSAYKRRFLSKFGTFISNLLLGTRFNDMTSGYQGFHREIVGKFLKYQLKSKAHFYQTELRYLLRETRFIEVPIHYRAPSPSVSKKAIKNAYMTLLYYFKLRMVGKAPVIDSSHIPVSDTAIKALLQQMK